MGCLPGPPRALGRAPVSPGPESSWKGNGSGGSDSSPCSQRPVQGHGGEEQEMFSGSMEATILM